MRSRSTQPASDHRPADLCCRAERLRDDRGQSLVEFALASAVFFALLLGTIEFGVAVFRYNMVANLAQEGARWASVRGGSSLSPSAAADVESYVQGRAPGMTVAVTTTPAPSSLNPGQTVTVAVQASYTPIAPLLPGGTMTLRSTAKMIVSR